MQLSQDAGSIGGTPRPLYGAPMWALPPVRSSRIFREESKAPPKCWASVSELREHIKKTRPAEPQIVGDLAEKQVEEWLEYRKLPRDWAGGKLAVVAWEDCAVLCLRGPDPVLAGMVVC